MRTIGNPNKSTPQRTSPVARCISDATDDRPLPPGISRWPRPDGAGVRCIVKVGRRGDQRSDTQVFPAGTPLDVVLRWQAVTRARLAGTRVHSDLGATLEQSVRVYLDRAEVRRMVGYRARASALKAWVDRMGPVSRRAISPTRVRRALAAWLEAGYAPQTVHHRRTALMALYHTLDGPDAPTPCDGVPSPMHCEGG